MPNIQKSLQIYKNLYTELISPLFHVLIFDLLVAPFELFPSKGEESLFDNRHLTLRARVSDRLH
jgi:hypothetical protein